MLFREAVAVYCENQTEHTDTVRTSQETHYVSATEPNRLMLFEETVAVYCENHTEHTNTVRTSQFCTPKAVGVCIYINCFTVLRYTIPMDGYTAMRSVYIFIALSIQDYLLCI
jgi:hypothetical protein